MDIDIGPKAATLHIVSKELCVPLSSLTIDNGRSPVEFLVSVSVIIVTVTVSVVAFGNVLRAGGDKVARTAAIP
jgi:hypothetical protein